MIKITIFLIFLSSNLNCSYFSESPVNAIVLYVLVNMSFYRISRYVLIKSSLITVSAVRIITTLYSSPSTLCNFTMQVCVKILQRLKKHNVQDMLKCFFFLKKPKLFTGYYSNTVPRNRLSVGLHCRRYTLFNVILQTKKKKP